MKKLIFVLIALMLAASLAVAIESSPPMPTVPESDTAVGTSLVEAPVPKPSVVRKAVSRIHLTGSGLAISEGDAFDFTHAKVVVGAVKVRATPDDGTAEAFVSKRLGVLILDKDKYHLKDIAVSDGEISAEVYGPTTTANAASEPIGQLKVKRFEKPGQDIWAGNMVLNNESYNIYLLGMKRQFKLAEVTEKVGEYCSGNTGDSRCRNIVSECARNTEQCKNKVSNYCELNTSDLKCLQLKKLYCLKNALDERCRDYLKDLCEETPGLAHCRIKTVAGKAVASINSNKVLAITAEKGENARNFVKSKIRKGLENMKTRIDESNPGNNLEDS